MANKSNKRWKLWLGCDHREDSMPADIPACVGCLNDAEAQISQLTADKERLGDAVRALAGLRRDIRVCGCGEDGKLTSPRCPLHGAAAATARSLLAEPWAKAILKEEKA